jgi:putative ABC transport system ATP-binding protein
MAIHPEEGTAMRTVVVRAERVGRDPKSAAEAVVSARDVTRRYGSGDTAVDALRGVSVDIAKGRLTAVMGPSGSGKSTLMHILAGLDQPTGGEVTVAGVDVTSLDDAALTKLRRDHIGFIFQFFNLLPMLTAAENIALPLKLAGRRPDAGWLDELIDTVGLRDRLGHRPSELSGGQQQRVAVALVARPTVIFADEPTGNLDSTTSGEILALLRRSVDSLGRRPWCGRTRTPPRSPTACCSWPTARSCATSAAPARTRSSRRSSS